YKDLQDLANLFILPFLVQRQYAYPCILPFFLQEDLANLFILPFLVQRQYAYPSIFPFLFKPFLPIFSSFLSWFKDNTLILASFFFSLRRSWQSFHPFFSGSKTIRLSLHPSFFFQDDPASLFIFPFLVQRQYAYSCIF